MFFRFLIFLALATAFGTIGILLLRQLLKYGSIRNIFKSDKLEINSYWLPVGASPFGDELAVRVEDIKSDYVKFEVTPGDFDSLDMKTFLTRFNYVKAAGYRFPNLYELWEENSTNPFDKNRCVKILEVKAGWVKFKNENGEEESKKIEPFIAQFKFKDFATDIDPLLSSKAAHEQYEEHQSSEASINDTEKNELS